MRRLCRFTVASLTLMMAVCAAAAQTSSAWCDRIRAMAQEPAVAAAHWGFSVVAADGAALCSLNDAQLFHPASTNKLFTTAAALALLGPDHRYTTSVVASGTVFAGVLSGDLVLVGSGDPSFGTGDLPYGPRAAAGATAETASLAHLDELAAGVAASGVHSVSGNIVGDDSLFTLPPYPPGWVADDLLFGYGAPVSALSVHDNQVLVEIDPGNTNAAKAVVRILPDVPWYTLDNHVSLQKLSQSCDQRLLFERPPGSHVLKVTGDIPAKAGVHCSQAIAIDEPAAYAASALRQALLRHGVQVNGQAVARHSDEGELGGVFAERSDEDPFLRNLLEHHDAPGLGCGSERAAPADAPAGPPEQRRTTLATHTSAALLAELTFTNKVSENLHAELLLRTLGVAFTCHAGMRDALHVERQFLLLAGLAPGDFVLYDGSGLSDRDLLTPRSLTRLLTFAAGKPRFAAWRATLPVGGVDGTLTGRFTGSLKGRVFAKTGTLGESRALAGYVMAASGRSVAFSILADAHLPGTIADRAVMDRIVEAIAAAN